MEQIRNYGFLMNKFSSKEIIKNLSKTNLVSISPLEMAVKNKNNQTKRSMQSMKFQTKTKQTSGFNIN